MTVGITIVTIGLALSDGGYHYRRRATIGPELEVEVETIGLPLSDGCYHYRDYCRGLR